MRRTQQAVSAVLPSVGVTYGLRNVASRVSPSGNSLTRPTETQDKYAPARPRVSEESRNRTTGTARAIATNPLKMIPNLMKSPRREMFSSVITQLLVLGIFRSRVRLARVLHSARGHP